MGGRIGGLVGGYNDRCMGEYVNRLWGRQKDGRCISILICTSVYCSCICTRRGHDCHTHLSEGSLVGGG